MFGVERNADSVRTSMTACGRVCGYHFESDVLPVFFLDSFRKFADDCGRIGVTDYDPVIGNAVAEFVHIREKPFHSPRSSAFLADAEHFALGVHIDYRTDSEQSSHSGGKAADSAASAEKP